MPRGYRLLFVALAGLILSGAHPPAKQAQATYGAEEQKVAATQSAEPIETATPPYRPYSAYNPDPCYNAKNHDAADLCAQWRAAIAAEKAAHEARRASNLSVIAALLCSLTIGGLIWTIWQGHQGLERAREANEIARDTANESNRIAAEAQRPWLQIEISDITIQALSVNGRIMVNVYPDIVIENTGNRPAVDIKRIEKLSRYTSETKDGSAKFFYENKEGGRAQVSIITPNGNRNLEIFESIDLSVQDFKNSGVFCFIISITYGDGLTSTIRQTAQSFLIGKSLHQAGTVMSDFSPQELINASSSNPGKLGRTCAVMPLPGSVMT